MSNNNTNDGENRNNKGTLGLLAEHLALAVQPLSDAVTDLGSFQGFMLRLGWEVTSIPPQYAALSTLVKNIKNRVDALTENVDMSQIETLLDDIRQLHATIKGINQVPDGITDAPDFLSEIGNRLFELLLADYLATELPEFYNLLLALEIIELEDHEETPTRPGFVRTRIRLERLSNIISDPMSIQKLAYGWGTKDFQFDPLASYLQNLLLSMGVPASIQRVGSSLSKGYQPDIQHSKKAINKLLRIPIFDTDIGGKPVEAAISVLELPAQGDKLPGIIIQPHIPQDISSEYEISDNLTFRISAGSNLPSIFGILIRPNEHISVRYPFQSNTPPPSASFGVSLEYKPNADKLLLGTPSASRLQMGGLAIVLHAELLTETPELRTGLAFKDLAVILASNDQDSFIGKLFNRKDLTIPIPLGIEWSTKTGFHFSGNAGFKFSFNPRLNLGIGRIDEIQVNLHSSFQADKPPDLVFEVGASLSGKLGPISFSVEGIGFRLQTIFNDGNVGPFDISIGFNPPEGIGLAIDGSIVNGGGYLYFNQEKGEYAGIVNLEIKQVALTGIGILSTKRPDGKQGYSLLIILSAEFKPIQLGFGFTLRGVGGLMGVNRTASVEVLREGVKNRTLDSVLFPVNPIENAPRIISDLNRVFPDSEGRFVFGPMAKIGWGTPTAIIADVGMVLEMPDPVRLILLGKIRALLPTEDLVLVQMNIDVLGVLDFEKSLVAIDASLYDSRLLQYTLIGDMALRAGWGANRLFVLSVGGLNPRFQPPPNFPTLSPLQVTMGVGRNPRLNLEAYMAITSNTVQFGALLEIYAEAYGFNIKGHLGFDCLFQISPFEFVADISGGVAFRRGSTTIASVNLSGTLSGPSPWRARGKASISFFFLSASVRFDKEWGDTSQVSLPTIDVMSQLKAALEDPRNWSAVLPPLSSRSVGYRDTGGDPSKALMIDPFGSLVISQKVTPLNRKLTKFGNSIPASDSFFNIAEVSTGGNKLNTITEFDFFAPAQYREMSDDEKLAQPEFEKMESGVGVSAGGSGLRADMNSLKEFEMIFETYIIDLKGKRTETPNKVRITSGMAASMAEFAGIIKSRWWNSGEDRYSADEFGPAAQLDDEHFIVANTHNMRRQEDVFSEAGGRYTRSEASELMDEYIRRHPDEIDNLQVIPAYEVQAA